MRALLSALVLAASPLPSALGQTDLFALFEHRGGPASGWGHALVDAGDLDGDGAHDLVVGRFAHDGGEVATVHAGRYGQLLFRLHAPFVPMFFGDAIASVVDETGDGKPELAAIGSRSGNANSPNGMVLVYSGADGAVLRQLAPPPGVVLWGHLQARVYSPGDVDGDGHGDLMVRAAIPGTTATLLSGLDASPLFSVAPPAGEQLIGDIVARLSDHDGDGVDEFALPVSTLGPTRVEIHSGATGALLFAFDLPGLSLVSGNGEPLLGVADADGDGLCDLLLGDVFGNSVSLHSSASGALLAHLDCALDPIPCFGSRIAEVGDMNGDGRRDLLLVEAFTFGAGARIFGVDITGKPPVLFEELIGNLTSGWPEGDRLVALPGVDPEGFASFALFEDVTGQVSLRRFRPTFSDAR